MNGHDKLLNRYRIELPLNLETPLKAASGVAIDTTDSALFRNASGAVYVPGSSLRGACRSALERVLDAPGSGGPLPSACTLFTPTSCAERLETERKMQQPGDPDMTDEALFNWADMHLCDLCKLFGSTMWASRITLRDAVPVGDHCVTVRDGVGIDRDTGAARAQIKFDYEVLEPRAGTTLAVVLLVENLTATDREILDVLLVLLREGLHVGGKRTAGLGCLRLEAEPSVAGCVDHDALVDWIRSGGGDLPALHWEALVAC